ncbi:MAG: tRNA pseudouridine(55) synthase TruB [Alphaproteobacteria bacterium]
MARRKKGNPVSGWAIVDKPEGIGSTQVVGKVRRYFNAQKAGHAGTLDPLATGILPIALGEATKTLPFIVDSGKVYRFTVRWGVETDTLDREGEVTATRDARPTRDAVEAVLPAFTGEIEQTPPAYSAIKVDGERAYDMARRGEAPEMKPRLVQIDTLMLVDCPDDDTATFETACGKGTYIRSLARDLAKALGTVGHVIALRRLRVGPFDETRAQPLDAFLVDTPEKPLEPAAVIGHNPPREGKLLPLQTALDGIPAINVTEAETQRLRQGQPVSLLRKIDFDRVRTIEPGTVLLAVQKDQAIALVQFEKALLKPVRVFNP